MTEISKEWCLNMAKQEGDSDIAAGFLARDPETQVDYNEAVLDNLQLQVDNAKQREALHEIYIEAFNTIPPDGAEAAYDALSRILKIINDLDGKGANMNKLFEVWCDLSELAKRVDAFLESYKDSDDVWERLLGPGPYLTPPPFFAFRAKRKERELNERLSSFGLPKISEEVRMRFYSQWQDFDEDAGGFIHRRWIVAFGFSREDYQAMLRETEQ
jgi:hypothetical protein